jgi:hypothetical protein
MIDSCINLNYLEINAALFHVLKRERKDEMEAQEVEI